MGTEPEKLLLERSSEVRAVSRPICVGRLSARELLDRSRLARAVRLPISVGKLPVRALLLRSREVRACNSPTWTGMVPETPAAVVVLARSRAVTRFEATVTPSQFWIFSCEEEPVPQERRKLAGRLLLAEAAAQWFCMATRAWQSSTKSLLVPITLG